MALLNWLVRNIIFTENGSIRSTSLNTVNLSATEVIDFGSPLVESTILESSTIILNAETIRGTQRAVCQWREPRGNDRIGSRPRNDGG